MHPLESEVDFKKLNLLGQLFRNDTHCWITPVFRVRLESYFVNPTGQIGFFPRYKAITGKIWLI